MLNILNYLIGANIIFYVAVIFLPKSESVRASKGLFAFQNNPVRAASSA
jgi:hypothetical protein